MTIRRLQPADFDEWSRMRTTLWPHCTADESRRDLAQFLANPGKFAVFVSEAGNSRLNGFLDASLRDTADDCETSPVGYIEGWYVDSNERGRGIGRALVEAAEEWARALGCREMASDTHLTNLVSQQAHARLGYRHCDTLMHFHKRLALPA